MARPRARATALWALLTACAPEATAPPLPPVPWTGRFERSASFDAALADITLDPATEAQSSAFSVDFDADGLRDVVVSVAPPSGLHFTYVVRQTSPGVFAPAELIPERITDALVATDLDGDGRTDLLFGRPPLTVGWGTDAGIVITPPAPIHRWEHRAIEQVLPLDLDGDGRLDLVVSTWDDDYALYREADGTYTEVPLGVGETFAHCAFDFDRDGRLDLYNMTEGAWRENNANGVLRNAGERRWEPYVPVDPTTDDDHYFTAATPEEPQKGTPMSCATADFLGDATPELFVSQSTCASPFYTLDADGVRWREAPVAGLGGICDDRMEIFWGASFSDLDADGLPDLVVAAGNDFGHLERTGVRGASRLHVHWNAGAGRLVAVDPMSIWLEHPGDFQSLVTEDVDGDGYPDLLVGAFVARPRLYLNRLAPRGNALAIELDEPASDGLRVDVEVDGVVTTRRAGRESATWRITGDRTIHVGLGDATEATATVFWRSGPETYALSARAEPWVLAPR